MKNNNYEETICEYRFNYKDNEQIKKAIKKIMIDEDITQSNIANKMNISRQNFYSFFNKKTLSLEDIKKLCDILGYDFTIQLTKKENKQ